MVTTPRKTHVFHELKRSLRAMGFVNITGLLWVATMHDEEGNVQANKKTLCRWNNKDNITIAVLENGEVWMRWGEVSDDLRNFLRRICPKGTGAQTNLSCHSKAILALPTTQSPEFARCKFGAIFFEIRI